MTHGEEGGMPINTLDYSFINDQLSVLDAELWIMDRHIGILIMDYVSGI